MCTFRFLNRAIKYYERYYTQTDEQTSVVVLTRIKISITLNSYLRQLLLTQTLIWNK